MQKTMHACLYRPALGPSSLSIETPPTKVLWDWVALPVRVMVRGIKCKKYIFRKGSTRLLSIIAINFNISADFYLIQTLGLRLIKKQARAAPPATDMNWQNGVRSMNHGVLENRRSMLEAK